MSDKLARMAKFVSEANKKFKKQYGEDVLYVGNELQDFAPFETGFPTFDWGNSGIGGFPRGGMTLLHGLESTGKSTFVLEAARHSMRKDKDITVLYIDVESAMTKSFFKYKDMDSDRFTLTSLNTEDALIAVEMALKEKVYDLVVLDSLAKMESTKILEKELGESAQRNRRAVMITEFLRRITFILRRSNSALVCINQEIQNQDPSPYAPKTVLPCGMQQKFSANLRIELKRSKALKDSDGNKLGYQVNVTSIKNKISNKEKTVTTLTYLYDRGFVREFSLIDYLLMIGYIKKLPMKRYEFVKKEFYQEPFKAGEIIRIVADIKETYGVDLYTIEPGQDVEFEKDENAGDTPASDEIARKAIKEEEVEMEIEAGDDE